MYFKYVFQLLVFQLLHNTGPTLGRVKVKGIDSNEIQFCMPVSVCRPYTLDLVQIST